MIKKQSNLSYLTQFAKAFFVILLLGSFSFLKAQDLDPVKWIVELTENESQQQLMFTAKIDGGWYLYSQDITEGGPIPTTFSLANTQGDYELIHCTEQSSFRSQKVDEMFQMELIKYQKEAQFIYNLNEEELSRDVLKVSVEFMCCDDMQCLPPKLLEFSVNLK